MGLTSFTTSAKATPTYSLGSTGLLGTNTPTFTGGRNYTIGTAAGNVNVVYASLSGQSVTNGTPLVLNVQNGSLRDLNGNTIALTTFVGYQIIYRSGTGDLSWGAGTHPIANVIGSIGPNGDVLIENPNSGYAVSAGATDSITFLSSSGTITFDLIFFGR